jgi:hypothetical protein
MASRASHSSPFKLLQSGGAVVAERSQKRKMKRMKKVAGKLQNRRSGLEGLMTKPYSKPDISGKKANGAR